MGRLLLLPLLCVLFQHGLAGPNSKRPFVHVLKEAESAFYGRVAHDAARDARVEAVPDEDEGGGEGEEEAVVGQHFLKILIDPVREGKTKKPGTAVLYMTTAPAKHSTEHNPSHPPENSDSTDGATEQEAPRDPTNLRLAIYYTGVFRPYGAFRVNKDNFVAVNDSSLFGDHHTHVDIYVVLEGTDGIAASNPLPFIIFIERPETSTEEFPTVPAVFAGVLVLFIVMLALLIPFVTRAKRRYKEGKPMFRLGSHPSRADLQSESDYPTLPRRDTQHDWYGNNAFNYEEEVEKEKIDFSKELKRFPRKVEEPPTLQLTKKKRESPQGAEGSSVDYNTSSSVTTETAEYDERGNAVDLRSASSVTTVDAPDDESVQGHRL